MKHIGIVGITAVGCSICYKEIVKLYAEKKKFNFSS